MKKTNKKILILSLVSLLIIAVVFAFYFGVIQQTAFKPSNLAFQQFTGIEQCGSSYCKPESTRLITAYNSAPVLRVGNSNYTFITAAESTCGNYDCGGSSCTFYKCCETINIYKDNVLINKTAWGYDGSRISENSHNKNVYLPLGDNNTQLILSMMDANYVSNSACSSITNGITIVFADNAFDIDIAPLANNVYHVGDNISVDVTIINNFGPAIGNLVLNAKVPTIIGTKEVPYEQPVIINFGINHYTFNFPADKITETLDLTPSIELFYDTTNINGLNYNNINAKQQTAILLGTVTANTTSLSIVDTLQERNSTVIVILNVTNTTIVYQNVTYNNNQTINVTGKNSTTSLTCIELGCPADYTCDTTNRVCKATVNNFDLVYWILGITASLATIIWTIYYFVKKKK
jgi:hypothetical protein